MTLENYQLASVVIAALNAFFVLVGTISIFMLRKQIKISAAQARISAEQARISAEQAKISAESFDANMEENKRSRTIEVIHTWTSELKKESRLVENLLDELDENSCKKIYNFKPFVVNAEIFDVILQICFIDCLENVNVKAIQDKYKKGDEFSVSGYILSELRWHITYYLNSLEVVAISWQQGLVDRDVLCQQFSFLTTNGRNTLEKYRKIAGGGNSYPATEAFCQEISKKRDQYFLKSKDPKEEIKIH